jgi:hypothetical protein
MSGDGEVLERLVRIEVKLDTQLTRADDHETRIRRMERALWLASGGAAAAGGVLGTIAQQIMGGG